MIEEALPFIAGSWRKTLSEKIAPSFNPSTGDVLGSYVLGTPEDIDDAVSAAAGAQLALGPGERVRTGRSVRPGRVQPRRPT
jgi:acyl-CoA reductase-like NAD-dependent aldehyde dehydrogenase